MKKLAVSMLALTVSMSYLDAMKIFRTVAKKNIKFIPLNVKKAFFNSSYLTVGSMFQNAYCTDASDFFDANSIKKIKAVPHMDISFESTHDNEEEAREILVERGRRSTIVYSTASSIKELILTKQIACCFETINREIIQPMAQDEALFAGADENKCARDASDLLRGFKERLTSTVWDIIGQYSSVQELKDMKSPLDPALLLGICKSSCHADEKFDVAYGRLFEQVSHKASIYNVIEQRQRLKQYLDENNAWLIACSYGNDVLMQKLLKLADSMRSLNKNF